MQWGHLPHRLSAEETTSLSYMDISSRDFNENGVGPRAGSGTGAFGASTPGIPSTTVYRVSRDLAAPKLLEEKDGEKCDVTLGKER